MSAKGYQKTKFEETFEKFGNVIDKIIIKYKQKNILSIPKLLDCIKYSNLSDLEVNYNSNAQVNLE
jgi:ureidoglycolate hydrolase